MLHQLQPQPRSSLSLSQSAKYNYTLLQWTVFLEAAPISKQFCRRTIKPFSTCKEAPWRRRSGLQPSHSRQSAIPSDLTSSFFAVTHLTGLFIPIMTSIHTSLQPLYPLWQAQVLPQCWPFMACACMQALQPKRSSSPNTQNSCDEHTIKKCNPHSNHGRL